MRLVVVIAPDAGGRSPGAWAAGVPGGATELPTTGVPSTVICTSATGRRGVIATR